MISFTSQLLIMVMVLFMGQPPQAEKTGKEYLILVSFDGFRHDYIDKVETPNFDKFIANGAAAEKLIPSFPSKTFPNHYSIVTGMSPGNNGLVDNTFYDATINKIYSIGNRETVADPFYYGGTPIWRLAQEHGLITASYFWIGSEAKIMGSYPDYYKKYDQGVPNKARIDQIIKWLKLPEEKRPTFLSLYFSILDDAGHRFGPDSKEVEKAVEEADILLGYLMKKLAKTELPVNVIITSDHGMQEMVTQEDTYIPLDDLVDLNNKEYLAINNGTHVHIYGRQQILDSLHDSISLKIEGFNLYRKASFPNQWNYKHYRAGDLLLTADPGKYFATKAKVKYALAHNKGQHWGTHGYNYFEAPEMGGIFYANGPAIKKGVTIPAFENVHIYPFMADLLNLSITHNIDGQREILQEYRIVQ